MTDGMRAVSDYFDSVLLGRPVLPADDMLDLVYAELRVGKEAVVVTVRDRLSQDRNVGED